MTIVKSRTAEAVVTDWVESFNTQTGIPSRELCRDDVVVHAAADRGSELQGLARVAALLQVYRDAVPDAQFSVASLEPQGDRLRCRWVARGVNRGPLLGMPPTNRPVEASGTCHARVADGLISELWFEVDIYGLLEQVGALLPAPGVVSETATRVGREVIEGLVAFLSGTGPSPASLGPNLPVHLQCFSLRSVDYGDRALETLRGYLTAYVTDMRLRIDEWLGQGSTLIGRGRIAGVIGRRGRVAHRLYFMARVEGERAAELWVRTGRMCHDAD